MSKQIVFSINKEGNVTINKIEGYGSSCLETTKFLEKRLGIADESSRQFTDEYEKPTSCQASEHIEH
jgi:hypothetical protein